MNVTPLDPIGAVVTDLSIAEVAPDFARQLSRQLAEYGILSFPDQHIDDSDFVGFLRRFGELTFTVGETPVDGFDDLNVVTNVGRETPPRSTFHTDTSYVRRPPAYTALRAVEVPARGGDTLFTDQYRAAATLPIAMRRRLEGRSITHVVSGLDLADVDGAETSADHPIFRPHPISGRTALYLSTPQRCVAIDGMDADESDATIRFLFDHSTTPDNIVRHTWRAGDVVMWDNRCVLHRADHSNVEGDRVLHRGMVGDSSPPARRIDANVDG